MTKAILVIDMPTECVECPLCSDGQCDALGIYMENVFNQKHERCPLRPLPKKLDAEDSNEPWFTEYRLCDGWNACLEEITEETE